MQQITLFLSEEDFKSVFTTVQPNVDPALVIPWIRAAQQIHIERRLGKALTSELKTQIESETLTEANRTLLEDWIAAPLAWATLYEAIPSLHMKYTNLGIVLKTADNSSSVSIDELNLLRGQALNGMQVYMNDMLNFLHDNSATYPLWRDETASTRVNRGVFKSGILIPTRRYGNK